MKKPHELTADGSSSLRAIIEKWELERAGYEAGATQGSDLTVQAMNRASAETCRRLLFDLAALEAHAVPPYLDPSNHHNALTCPYCNPKGLKFAEARAVPPDLRGYEQHKPDCPQWRAPQNIVCEAPEGTERSQRINCRLTAGHQGRHANGSLEWDDARCNCGLDARLAGEGHAAAQYPDQVCKHGTALDVHCCNCHSGFIFERDHVCQDDGEGHAVPPLHDQLQALRDEFYAALVVMRNYYANAISRAAVDEILERGWTFIKQTDEALAAHAAPPLVDPSPLEQSVAELECRTCTHLRAALQGLASEMREGANTRDPDVSLECQVFYWAETLEALVRPRVCGVKGDPPLGDHVGLLTCELQAGHTGSHRSGRITWLGYWPKDE